MRPTLTSLLAQEQLHLRLLQSPRDAADLAEPLTWAHSSDLADPTPWLEPGQLLLTDGAQFLGDGVDPDAYVTRLVTAQVRALAMSTRVLLAQIPESVRVACERHGLALIEVADRTPFIEIIRHVAEQIAQENQQRLRSSLQAHRAVARAALRPDGLAAVLTELESRLQCWVALFGPAGEPIPIATARPMPTGVLPAAAEAVRSLLGGGRRAAARVVEGDVVLTIQTVGGRDHLRGALVVGTLAELDSAGTDLVNSVIALASIALDQTRRLEGARRRLRTGLLELLLSGESSVARRTAAELWGPLPSEPLRVVMPAQRPTEALITRLEQYAAAHPADLFYAERAARLHLIMPADHLGPVLALLGAPPGNAPPSHAPPSNAPPSISPPSNRSELVRPDAGPTLSAQATRSGRSRPDGAIGGGVGVSGPVGWADLSDGLEQAARALERATGSDRVLRFDDLADEGLMGYLAVGGGPAVARRMLAPLLDLPVTERELLIHTVQVWTEHCCAWEPAARELHVHRHTVRNRIDHLGRLLGLDLDTFAARAELWSALHLVRTAG
ncbi:MAG: PucR family transcriptional regulator ligand-binding domain-containing protein [Actinomycetales bacterium]